MRKRRINHICSRQCLTNKWMRRTRGPIGINNHEAVPFIFYKKMERNRKLVSSGGTFPKLSKNDVELGSMFFDLVLRPVHLVDGIWLIITTDQTTS